MSVYSRVGNLRPRRSAFNLSHEKQFDCDLGQLIPVLFQECIPGDTMKIGNEIVIRFQPMVSPVLNEINAYVHYFFVPARLLMDNKLTDWHEFISGGADGQTSITLPKWTHSTGYNIKYSLWDYFGLPVGVNPSVDVCSFPKRAYNLVYNEYYRDENLQTEINVDNDVIANRDWAKDYFTSALPFAQRGIAPSLPLSGLIPLSVINASMDNPYANLTNAGLMFTGGSSPVNYVRSSTPTSSGTSNLYATSVAESSKGYRVRNVNKDNGVGFDVSKLDSGKYGVDLHQAVTFDVNDLRLVFQMQKFMERNMRGGIRYTEFLQAHFGISPRDEVLQRPVYIGGSKSPVMISEVLQTSQSNSGHPQGNLAGHGLVADKNYITSYHAKEFGYIIGIMSVMPKAAYTQGIPRYLLRETRYDFYFPEFAHLGEQGVFNAEVYADGSTDDKEIFGYQGRYNEMRSAQSIVCGDMRDTQNYWNISRLFASRPNLNSTFLTCTPRKDYLAVPSQKALIVNVGNIVKAIRPMPAMAEPGLIDHN